MQCPFCSAGNPRRRAACRVCGGPLGGTSFHPPRPSPENAVAAATSNRVVVTLPPLEPIVPVTVPTPPVLLARYVVEKNAPRIVTAAWVSENGASFPLLMAENGALKLWDVPRDKLHSISLRRAFHLLNPTTTTGALVVAQAVTSTSQTTSAQSAIIATCRESGQICLQRLECDAGRDNWKSTLLKTMQAHRGRVESLAVAGERLYSAGSDGAVVLTVLSASMNEGAVGCEPQVILDGLDALSCLALSPDGRLLALGGDDGQVQMWQLELKGTAVRLDWTTRKTHSPIKSLGFAPNGNMLISNDAQGCCCLRAARTGHELQRMSQQLGAPRPAFAPDSRLLALTNNQGGIALFDAWTGNLRHILDPVAGSVQTLAFSPTPTTAAPETLLVVAGSQQFVAWKIALF